MSSEIEEVEILTAACCIAASDGEITEDESRILRRFQNRVGVGDACFEAMLDRARKDPEYRREQMTNFHADPERAVGVLIEVALADGAIGPRERLLIESVARRLNVPSGHVDELIRSRQEGDSSSPHQRGPH